jgi:chromosome segregation ATPase
MVKRRIYRRLRGAVAAIQRRHRRRAGERERAAREVQRVWRGWYEQGRYWGFVKCMVALQARARARRAKGVLKELKSDAKSVDKMAKEVEKGKGEILALRRMLKEREDGRRRVEEGHSRRDGLEEEVKVWKERAAALERDAVAARVKSQRKMEEELAKVRRELRDERGRRVRAEAELVRIRAKAEGIDISDINIEGNLSSYDEETDEWTDEETEDNDISEGEEGGGRRLKSPTPRSPGRGVLKRTVRRGGGGGERGGNLYYELKG